MSDTETDILLRLSDPELDPLFAEASRIGEESAWFGHVPLARWLVAASRPRLLVELGTHNGISYAAFCDAVLANRLQTRAAAIDTWQGDAQAGFYDSQVYDNLKAFHDPRYGAFSSLIRARFDDACAGFDDGSIDLLHIDGEHSYASVRHDFETWTAKLSDRAVVLFHDTQIRRPGYGVWQLWEELRQIHKGFEFLHASGLGLLGFGNNLPAKIADLLDETCPAAIERIRGRFAALGARWQREAEIRLLTPQLENALRTAEERKRALADTSSRLQIVTDEAHRLGAALLSSQEKADTAAVLRLALEDANRDHQALLNSTLWRAAAPLRALASRLPRSSRARLRRLIGSTRQRLARNGTAEGQTQPPPASPETPIPPLPAPLVSSPLLAARRPLRHRIIFVSGEPDIPGHVYRVERYAEAFAAAGAVVSWMRIDEAEHRIAEIAAASIVILWRASSSSAVERVIAAARDADALLVFDVDDLMFRPELARAGIIDAIRKQNLRESDIADFYLNVQKILVQADVSFTSTDELAVHAQRFDRLTFVLPNGFDAAALSASRLAVRRRHMRQPDNTDRLLRIGYAAGTRSHQKDFKAAAGAVARVLGERPDCRLVLFRGADGRQRMLDPGEFPELADLEHRIEWRDLVALDKLPDEMARFDINIAPLELKNPFVEAKSELKYFEAALVEIPTIASPTGPFRRAIRNNETGILAETEAEWYAALDTLLNDAGTRRRMAHAAYLDVLWRFGPERRAEAARSVLHQLDGGPEATRAFELDWRRSTMRPPVRQDIPLAETMFEVDRLGSAEVTVVIPLYNYAHYVTEALDSVRRQSLQALDLIVIDDGSTDASLAVAREWAARHADRFNRLLVLRNRENSGLSRTRNLGFDRAETPFVLPLDADNRLLEDCAATCLRAVTQSHAAFAYPVIRNFGDADHLIGDKPYAPMRLASANYIDAMAMVRKSVWAAVGGFAPIRFGWEDYDFWCRCAEQGFAGVHVAEVLAEYRFHASSMLRTVTDIPQNKLKVIEQLDSQHGWLRQSREI